MMMVASPAGQWPSLHDYMYGGFSLDKYVPPYPQPGNGVPYVGMQPGVGVPDPTGGFPVSRRTGTVGEGAGAHPHPATTRTTQAPPASSVQSTLAVSSARTQLVVDAEEPLEGCWWKEGWFPVPTGLTILAPAEEEESNKEVWINPEAGSGSDPSPPARVDSPTCIAGLGGFWQPRPEHPSLKLGDLECHPLQKDTEQCWWRGE